MNNIKVKKILKLNQNFIKAQFKDKNRMSNINQYYHNLFINNLHQKFLIEIFKSINKIQLMLQGIYFITIFNSSTNFNLINH